MNGTLPFVEGCILLKATLILNVPESQIVQDIRAKSVWHSWPEFASLSDVMATSRRDDKWNFSCVSEAYSRQGNNHLHKVCTLNTARTLVVPCILSDMELKRR